MKAVMMATVAAVFAFGGGMLGGMTVQTFFKFPAVDVRGEVAAALEQHDAARRAREAAETEAFLDLQKKEQEEMMRGWGDPVPGGRATTPWARGAQQ
jgi:hypothetical protein